MNARPPLRLAFMGSPAFSVPTLQALLDAGHEVVCVYAQPPKPAGRGQRERPCAVHAAAVTRGIAVRTPPTLKDASEQAAFRALDLDAAVVVAFGMILPPAILEASRFGCVNVHASLLPRWRGAAPIQRAIQAGDVETGITIMRMDEGLDTGPMLATARTPIAADETGASLHDRLAAMGGPLLVETLAAYAAGSLTPEPQPEEGATYAAKIDKSESRLDFRKPAIDLARTVRAFDPWPGTWFDHDGTRIKVVAAVAEPATGIARPGTVIDDGLAIACGDGALRPTELQRPGKAPMPVAVFLRGYDLPVGTVLVAGSSDS